MLTILWAFNVNPRGIGRSFYRWTMPMVNKGSLFLGDLLSTSMASKTLRSHLACHSFDPCVVKCWKQSGWNATTRSCFAPRITKRFNEELGLRSRKTLSSSAVTIHWLVVSSMIYNILQLRPKNLNTIYRVYQRATLAPKAWQQNENCLNRWKGTHRGIKVSVIPSMMSMR